MMEIGNEISQKIRSAIKAKLLDLGAYVDDELPDYIMVMVANKKTKAQMTEDLNLFLGTHTDKFTSWLHSLLCKLQSITAEMTPGGEGSDHTGKTGKEQSVLDEEAWATATGSSDTVTKTIEEPKTQSKENSEVPEAESSALIEPEINLRPEHDEFEEEVQAEMEKQKKEAKASQRRKRVSSTTDRHASTTECTVSKAMTSSEVTKSTVSTTSNMEKKQKELSDSEDAKRATDKSGGQISPKKRRHSKEHNEKTTGRVAPRRRQSSKDTEQKSTRDEKTSQGSRHVKKKRPLTSSVGAVIKHDVYASDDEYDPLNPAVGNVASVVKVTERKSSIPPDMQPNKSLLLKAMEAAHKSIETATQKLASKAIVKPTVRTKDSENAQNTEASHDQRKEEVIEEKRSVKSVRSRLGGRHKPSMSERLGEGRKVELVTRSSKESSRRIMSRKSSQDSDDVLKAKRRKQHISSEDSPSPSEHKDSRQVEITVTRNVQRKRSSQRPDSGRDVRERKAVDEDSEEDDLVKILMQGAEVESDFTEAEDIGKTDGNEEDSGQSERIESAAPDINPKFVVTLDGAEAGAMEKEEVVEDIRHVSPAKNVVMVKPQRPTVDPVLINLHEDNDEEPITGITPTVTSPEVQKVQEKCRFWPACKTGDLCPYIHPSTQCLKFPNCHFGERCLYIHPACKFDSQCTRPRCPYTHSAKRAAVPPTTSIVIQPVRVPVFQQRFPAPVSVSPRSTLSKDLNCKFFPNCTNMECPFRHPKPCRFGIGCVHKDTCYFYHPTLPGKSQLKWSSQASKKVEVTSPDSLDALVSP